MREWLQSITNWPHQSVDLYREISDKKMTLVPFRFNIPQFIGILQKKYCLQTYFRDIVGSDYKNKVSHIFFVFPVHIKVRFTLYCSLLSV